MLIAKELHKQVILLCTFNLDSTFDGPISPDFPYHPIVKLWLTKLKPLSQHITMSKDTIGHITYFSLNSFVCNVSDMTPTLSHQILQLLLDS